jgi:hypothetical protein
MGLVVAGGIQAESPHRLTVFGQHANVEVGDEHEHPGCR